MEATDLLFWGCFGMLVEICFTSIADFIKTKQLNLIGHVSLWMFPVYAIGLTYGFDLIAYLIPITALRWLSYPLWIWSAELALGGLLLKYGIRAWDYSHQPDNWHWKGLISYAYYPAWVGFGVLVELMK